MAPLTDNLRGALLMMGGMVAFTCNDALVKSLGDEMPMLQVLSLRGLITTFVLGLLAARLGQIRYRPARSDRRLIALRAVAEVASAWMFMTALFNMPLANASAIMQSLPLAVTLMGALVLGEAVGWKRVGAILVGFVGVLLIVQPGGEGFNLYSVMVLGAVGWVTVRDLAARRMTQAVPSVFVAFVTSSGVTLMSLMASVLVDWQPVTGSSALRLGAAALFLVVGYVCLVSAMRVGEIGIVAPFRYASLIAALILGLVVFGTFPGPLALAGAALVVGSGLFTLYRERVTRRGHAAQALAAPR
ncbi:DMT family transporter [uncultured Limimaricola sp.]|uniref:DMT family transporter n=1 Tax=uncultured Limimaricola sp. TaxID=2211667 RepID=UPI0030FB3C6B